MAGVVDAAKNAIEEMASYTGWLSEAYACWRAMPNLCILD